MPKRVSRRSPGARTVPPAQDRMLPPIPNQRHLRTVILGAGIAGRLVLEELKRHQRRGYVPVGFLDDDPHKHCRRIGGVPVLGPLSDLPTVARRKHLQLAILAIPSAPGEVTRRISHLVHASGLELRTVPGLYGIIQQDTEAGFTRPVNLEDFFRREPIAFDVNAMRQALTGKVILITGAAGSIGQELCRQLAKFEPRQLILFDHEENNLYESSLRLRAQYPGLVFQPVIGDIRDRPRVRAVLQTHRPEVIYHAAAYKHVPVMEQHVLEGIKTNILGTAVLVEEAARAGIRRFVLISTDKAVRPSSVMGACKRFAELLVQSAAKRFPATALMIVRFGNVIPSRGNVVERFQEQIARGGPVTITHPKMERYFMTCEEAAQLVMQASAWGRGGELFILDMGKPVRISELAKEMIRLAGLVPGRDVPIVYAGVRGGEKLREELMTPQERAHSVQHRRIRVVDGSALPWRAIAAALLSFRQAAAREDALRGRRVLHRYVTTYEEPTSSFTRRPARSA